MNQRREAKAAKLLGIDPPYYLMVSLVTIVVLHSFLPEARLVPAHWNLLGGLPLLAGVVVNLMADRSFKERATSVKPLGKTSGLVTTGVFRISRHPMYLGFVLILLGAAVLAGSATPFLVVAGFLAFIDVVFVRVEEAKLAQLFGNTWSDYAAGVGHWI